MTEATLHKLNEAFALGCSDKEACFFADIAPSTLYNYQEKNPEFVERKSLLKERPILLARRSVVNALETDPDLALKFLERRKRDEFSLKQEVEHTVGFFGQPQRVEVEIINSESANEPAQTETEPDAEPGATPTP